MPTVGGLGGYQPWNEGLAYPPGPYAWPAGQSWPINGDSQVNGEDLNEQLSLPLNFLLSKPIFQGAQFTANQTIPNGVVTPITLDTEFADAWGMHGNVMDNSQVVVPLDCDGYYLVTGCVTFTGTITQGKVLRAMVQKNGSVYSQGQSLGWATSAAGTLPIPGYMDLIPLNAGDYVQLAAYQGSGAALTTGAQGLYNTNYSNAQYPQLSIRYVNAFTGVAGLPAPNISTFFRNPVASADFNSYIETPVNMLSFVPMCRVTQTTGTSTPASTLTTMTGMTVSFDNMGAYNTSTSTWTCPASGVYLCMGQAGWPTQAAIFQGSAALQATSGGNTGVFYGTRAGETDQPVGTVVRKMRLNAGDTIQLAGYQTSGSTLTSGTGNAGDVRFFALWISR